MNTPDEQHPAGNGLMDSGYVVSVVRSAIDMRMNILGEGHIIGLTFPGNPCGVLLCCSAQGAQALMSQLATGLAQVRSTQEHDQ